MLISLEKSTTKDSVHNLASKCFILALFHTNIQLSTLKSDLIISDEMHAKTVTSYTCAVADYIQEQTKRYKSNM